MNALNNKHYINHNNKHVYDHMLRLHVPAGSHAFYAEHHTSNRGEQEIILHKNAKIHIHETPELDHKNKKVIWHAKLAHDGIKATKHMQED